MSHKTFNKEDVIENLKTKPKSTRYVYPRHKDDIDAIYPNIQNSSEKLWLLKENLIEQPKCNCGKSLMFKRFSDGYFKTCGDKECIDKLRNESIKDFCLTNYGVTNASKLDTVKQKGKDTYFKKTGYYHNSKNPDSVNRINKTMIERYGVEKPLQNKELKKKQENTTIDRHGTTCFLNSEKSKKTLFENWGVTHPMYNEEIREKCRMSQHQTKLKLFLDKIEKTNKIFIKIDEDKRIHLNCLKCGNNYTIHRCCLNYHTRSNSDSCPTCNFPNRFRSKKENEVYAFIQENTDLTVSLNKHFGKYEVDIFIEELNLAIEFNGVYWHSELYKEASYHQEKSIELEKRGINLIHIWEDDWINKSEIVKNIILSKIKPIRIGARKTIIQKIDFKTAKEFHLNNHLDGYAIAKYHYGLFYENDLISVASFGNSRYNKIAQYELIRLTTKSNFSIIGGFSKLLKAFKNETNFESLLSYKKLDLGTKNFYEAIGFKKTKRLKPNFFWLINGIKVNRQNFMKHKLKDVGDKTAVQYMIDKGYYRIYDSGSDMFILNN